MTTLAYLPIKEYYKPVLNRKQLKLIPAHFQNEDWFVSAYQARVQKENPKFYTLRTLLEAVKNSEEQFQQYPTDDRNVKDIARSIFIEDQWLMRDVTLAICAVTPYIVGGRHRVAAIASVFACLVVDTFKAPLYTEDDQQQAFDAALQQNIRCEVLHLQTMSDLLTMVKADNESRTMRKAEQSHLDLQLLGADSHSVESVGRAVLHNELDAKQAIALAAQAFVRRTDSRLKAQTRQVLGEKIAKFVLFGGNEKVYKHTPVNVNSIDEFNVKMDKAWDVLNTIIEGEEVVAKYAQSLSERVIKEISDSPELLAVELTEVHPEAVNADLDEVIVPVPAPRGRKKRTEAVTT